MSPWPLPLLFSSWQYRDGPGGAVEVARRACLLGAPTVAVQLSEPALTPEMVKAMRDAQLFVVGWDSVGPGTAQRLTDLGVQGFMPQIETDAQRVATVAALQAGVGASLPKAVVTSYGGLDTQAKVAEVKSAGVDTAFVECYADDGPPHNDVGQMLWQGGSGPNGYGFDDAKLFAVVGAYRGETPASYAGLDKIGRNFGVWIAELASDASLSAFGAISPTPTAAALNAQIVALCDVWLSKQIGTQPKSRLRNIRRIAVTSGNDPLWLKAQPGVTKSLTDAGVPLSLKSPAERTSSR